jgi:hypothetical protein
MSRNWAAVLITEEILEVLERISSLVVGGEGLVWMRDLMWPNGICLRTIAGGGRIEALSSRPRAMLGTMMAFGQRGLADQAAAKAQRPWRGSMAEITYPGRYEHRDTDAIPHPGYAVSSWSRTEAGRRIEERPEKMRVASGQSQMVVRRRGVKSML